MKNLLRNISMMAMVVALAACSGGDDDNGGGSGGGGGSTPQTKTPNRTIAFPGADGGASNITGGAGGNVYIVNNLEDSGLGSLRNALQGNNRTIVFAVGGQINLKSKLTISASNITIAGQTAPGDGITIAGYPVFISGSNVILRFLRFRMGDKNINKANFVASDGDALGAKDCNNIMIDHCSISWSTDECASFSRVKNFTMQYCFITESMKLAGHEKGKHGYGGIWGGSNATYHHNLIANHDSRNPRFDHSYVGKTYCGPIDYYNNVVYGWGGNSTYGGETGTSNIFHINMQNNYYKPLSSSSHKDRLIEITTACSNCNSTAPCHATPGKFYLSGNYVNGTANKDWNGVEFGKNATKDKTTYTDNRTDAELTNMAKLTERYTSGLTAGSFMESATEAYNSVLNYAGASKKRDAVDERIITQVKNGTGNIIDSQIDVGGFPTLVSGTAPKDTDEDGIPDTWETTNGLNPNLKADGAQYIITDKYTNLEVYLNSLVTDCFPAAAKAGVIK